MNKDPKYLGIPNICFSFTDQTDDNDEYSKQRLERGFDDSETWSLDTTISRFILPRLRRFRELTDICPLTSDPLSFKDWCIILDKMIAAFELMNDDDAFYPSEDQSKIIDEGFDLFRKYYNCLWW